MPQHFKLQRTKILCSALALRCKSLFKGCFNRPRGRNSSQVLNLGQSVTIWKSGLLLVIDPRLEDEVQKIKIVKRWRWKETKFLFFLSFYSFLCCHDVFWFRICCFWNHMWLNLWILRCCWIYEYPLIVYIGIIEIAWFLIYLHEFFFIDWPLIKLFLGWFCLLEKDKFW